MSPSEALRGRPELETAAYVVARWAQALDGRDWATAESCIAERVYMDYSALNGSEAGERTRAELVGGWLNGVGRVASSQHLIGMPDVTPDGNGVRLVATAQVSMSNSAEPGGVRWSVGCRYVFSIVVEDGEWRIAGITLTVLWQEGDRTAAMAPVA
jgi:hypothetical protein